MKMAVKRHDRNRGDKERSVCVRGLIVCFPLSPTPLSLDSHGRPKGGSTMQTILNVDKHYNTHSQSSAVKKNNTSITPPSSLTYAF